MKHLIFTVRSKHFVGVRRYLRKAFILLALLFLLSVSSAQYSEWALQSSFFLLVPLVFAGLVYSVALVVSQRMVQRDLRGLLKDLPGPAPMMLYLRGFEAAQSGIFSRLFNALDPRRLNHSTFLSQTHRTYDVEEELSEAFSGHGLLIAIGNKRPSFGAAKVIVHDDDWKKEFERLSSAATLLILAPSSSEGLLWEMGQILEVPELSSKSIFVMARNSFSDEWRDLAHLYKMRFKVQFPPHTRRGCFFRLNVPDGKRCHVELEDLSIAINAVDGQRGAGGAKFPSLDELWISSLKNEATIS